MRDLPPITSPDFHRLTDYFGVWCFEPLRFDAMWALIRETDLAAHIAEQAAAQQPRGSNADLIPVKGGKSVAMLPVRGMMMKGQSSLGGTSTVQLRRDIRQAANDPNVSGILLNIDSPGGTAAGMADLVVDVRAASRKKPVWSQIEDLGASAAYQLAAASDAIYANSTDAAVGSIGTMMVVYDYSKAFDASGIKAYKFATGPLKGAGATGTELTQEQRDHFQTLIDSLQESFDQVVKTGRGLNASQLTAVKTGGVFLAKDAKQLGLIDGIRSLDSTLSALAAAS